MLNRIVSILNKEDLSVAMDLFNEFEAPEYPIEGINEFKNFINIDSFFTNIKNGSYFIWGYYINNKLVGIISTRPKYHISLLFVDKSYHRQGIAKALFNEILRFYKEDHLCEQITVNSSLYALDAYRHLGFVDTSIKQTINGITFIPMAYAMK